MTPPLATIVGGGLAGASAAASLDKLGWQTRFCAASTRRGHPIALNGASRFLIEHLRNEPILARTALHRLRRRIVAWQGSDDVQAIEDEAIVVDSAALAQAMRPPARSTGPASSSSADWTFVAESTTPRLNAGARTATAIEVTLGAWAEPDALLIEATEIGWLALLPTGGARATLFAFAPHSSSRVAGLVGGSRLVRRSLAGRAATSTSFDAAPTFSLESGTDRAFTIGAAAMTFDPLSGDGVASAIRSAHLAASLADAVHRGTDPEDARQAYSGRLARAMTVHLKGLIELYIDAPFAAAWAAEIAATESMIEALAPLAGNADVPAFPISGQGVLAGAAP